jgi:peptidoglycan-N-acetylglucosamine deacetylase
MAPASWPPGTEAGLSLSFDDARPSQIEYGVPLLEELGVKATFYVLPEPLERLGGPWRRVFERGHEIGAHTSSHPCSGNFAWSRGNALEDMDLDDIRRELVDADERIEAVVGGRPRGFAYPCGQHTVGRGAAARSYIPVVAERYVTARGAGQEHSADPSVVDLAHIPAFVVDERPAAWIRDLVDHARREGGWLVLVAHDVRPDGPARQAIEREVLDEVCRYAASVDGLWIDTVDAIGSRFGRTVAAGR